MKLMGKGVGATAAIAVTFVLAGALVAEESGDRVVIYPGDYVVQSGDVQADGTWRDGVTPSAVMVYPGEAVVQAGDVETLGRWRIDVDPFSGQATATAVTGRISAERFENEAELKVEEVSPHLNISLIDCTTCNGTTATFPRTIRVVGIFDPVPPATPAVTWQNPAIGWPSSPQSSGNVVDVALPARFSPPGPPYAANDPFAFEFDVQLDPVSTFSVYVDVVGDLIEPTQ
jgi:hypothetical protein